MCKILVVDKNDDYAREVAAMLKERGHNVIIASTKEECTKAVKENHIHAVLMDLDDIGNLSLLADLHGQGLKAFTVITGNQLTKDKLSGWELLDVFDVMRKTADKEQVVKHLEWAADLSIHKNEAIEIIKSIKRKVDEGTRLSRRLMQCSCS